MPTLNMDSNTYSFLTDKLYLEVDNNDVTLVGIASTSIVDNTNTLITSSGIQSMYNQIKSGKEILISVPPHGIEWNSIIGRVTDAEIFEENGITKLRITGKLKRDFELTKRIQTLINDGMKLGLSIEGKSKRSTGSMIFGIKEYEDFNLSSVMITSIPSNADAVVEVIGLSTVLDDPLIKEIEDLYMSTNNETNNETKTDSKNTNIDLDALLADLSDEDKEKYTKKPEDGNKEQAKEDKTPPPAPSITMDDVKKLVSDTVKPYEEKINTLETLNQKLSQVVAAQNATIKKNKDTDANQVNNNVENKKDKDNDPGMTKDEYMEAYKTQKTSNQISHPEGFQKIARKLLYPHMSKNQLGIKA